MTTTTYVLFVSSAKYLTCKLPRYSGPSISRNVKNPYFVFICMSSFFYTLYKPIILSYTLLTNPIVITFFRLLVTKSLHSLQGKPYKCKIFCLILPISTREVTPSLIRKRLDWGHRFLPTYTLFTFRSQIRKGFWSP